jgi:hypothetical protein
MPRVGLDAAAGLTMMICIFVEIAIMRVCSPLHGSAST